MAIDGRSAEHKAAEKSLYEAITKAVNELENSDYVAYEHAGQIRDLAAAYRLVSGGPQPGS